jgi:hypothetical protein
LQLYTLLKNQPVNKKESNKKKKKSNRVKNHVFGVYTGAKTKEGVLLLFTLTTYLVCFTFYAAAVGFIFLTSVNTSRYKANNGKNIKSH